MMNGRDPNRMFVCAGAVAVLTVLVCGVTPLRAGTFTSDQNGLYSASATWQGDPVHTPDNGVADDVTVLHEVTINGALQGDQDAIVVSSGGELVVTAPNGISSATVTVDGSSILYSPHNDSTFSDSQVTLAGGTVEVYTHHNNVNYGGAFIVTESGATFDSYGYGGQSKYATFGTLTVDGAGYTVRMVTDEKDEQTDEGPGKKVFGSVTFPYDVTLELDHSTLTVPGVTTLADGKTLVKTGDGSITLSGDNSATLLGDIIFANGTITFAAACSAGSGRFTLANTTGHVNVASCVSGATILAESTSLLYVPNVNSALSGSQVELSGGVVEVYTHHSDPNVGGDFLVTASGATFDSYGYGGQSRNATFGSISVDRAGYTVRFVTDESDKETGEGPGKKVFGRATFPYDVTLDVGTNSEVYLSDTAIWLGETVTKDGGGELQLRGDFSVGIAGSAALSATTNQTLLSVSDGTLTDAVGTWADADGLWSFDSSGTGVEAQALNVVATSVYGRAWVSFPAEDAGLVKITGLSLEQDVKLKVRLTNLDSDVAAVVTELQKNPAFEDVRDAGGDVVNIVLAPTASTMYFIWDNVVNQLGAHVSGLRACTPSGTVMLLL